MMSFKKGVLYVLIANIINLLINLCTGFILPKMLSIETYANIKLFQLYVTYIGVVSFGFADGMYLKIGGKNINELDKESVLEEFKTFKIFQFCISILAIIISLILKNTLLLFCSIVILPVNIGGYLRNLYQAVGQFKKYSRFTNINTILVFLINLLLLFVVKTDYYITYIVGYIVAYILYWIMIECETRKIFGHAKVNAKKKYLIEDIKSGIFLMLGNFCNVLFTSIDRMFIKKLLGMIQFAYYSFAVSVESLMNVFVTPISTVMYNYFCNNKECEKIINIKKYILLFASIVIIVIFPAKFIIDIWLYEYKNALSVLFLLFAAQYISIMVRCVHVNLYKAENKQNLYSKIMIRIVILSIVLNIVAYVFCKKMESIAVATLITNIIWFVIGEVEFKEYRLKKIDYSYVFLIMIVFLLCMNVHNAIFGMIYYGVLVLIITILLERNMIIKLWKEICKILCKNDG